MKKSWARIYREAARRIAGYEETYSCCAVGEQNKTFTKGRRHTINLYSVPTVRAYLDTFAERNAGGMLLQCKIEAEGDFAEHKHLRVMLLCMMATLSGDSK